MNEIINYYNRYDEERRLMRKSHMPEYLTTMRYIEKYLNNGAKIIEIGAGTGRYSLALADMGYDVTAVELVPHNINIMRKKVKPNHNIKIYEGNACDLSFIDSNTYDMVLLLGPMYHLFNNEDKHKAISEAIRIAKKGAVIYSSYCNNDTCMYKMFYKKRILSYLDNGLIEEDYHAKSSPNEIFELYRKPDIDELMKNYPVTRLHFVGVDMLSYLYNNKLDRLNKREFSEYMKFLSTICEREDLVGFSIHMLDIFRKD
ncbi:MAG: class I SAM-dependent methyltransferase [Eubacterium sp.]